MKPEHLHILQHSLGLNQYGRRASDQHVNSDDWNGCYRNRFVTGADSPDGRLCTEMVELGYMIDHGEQKRLGNGHVFQVTQAGFEAMRAASPRGGEEQRELRRCDAGHAGVPQQAQRVDRAHRAVQGGSLCHLPA